MVWGFGIACRLFGKTNKSKNYQDRCSISNVVLRVLHRNSVTELGNNKVIPRPVLFYRDSVLQMLPGCLPDN